MHIIIYWTSIATALRNNYHLHSNLFYFWFYKFYDSIQIIFMKAGYRRIGCRTAYNRHVMPEFLTGWFNTAIFMNLNIRIPPVFIAFNKHNINPLIIATNNIFYRRGFFFQSFYNCQLFRRRYRNDVRSSLIVIVSIFSFIINFKGRNIILNRPDSIPFSF